MGDFLQTPAERAWRYRELFAAVEEGRLDVRVGATFALPDAAEAHRALEGRRTTGKVLLEG
jgi:NADPH2:quinone reductase